MARAENAGRQRPQTRGKPARALKTGPSKHAPPRAPSAAGDPTKRVRIGELPLPFPADTAAAPATEIDGAMLASIREMLERDHVSFTELAQIEGFRGNLEWVVGENIVLCRGLSPAEAFDALVVIRTENEYEFQPASTLTYLLDGGMPPPDYPIAKQARNYAKPHFKRRKPAARSRA